MSSSLTNETLEMLSLLLLRYASISYVILFLFLFNCMHLLHDSITCRSCTECKSQESEAAIIDSAKRLAYSPTEAVASICVKHFGGTLQHPPFGRASGGFGRMAPPAREYSHRKFSEILREKSLILACFGTVNPELAPFQKCQNMNNLIS